ncbi:MAG: Txe/YoeB family addiction module toxin [Paludibacteraceae bacterium]
MSYNIVQTKTAVKDASKLKSASKGLKERLILILKELSLHPYEGIGNPEQLKYSLSNYWSRELTKKDRIVYSVDESSNTVTIYQYLGHYLDK